MFIRYIRDYLQGSTANGGCHWVEIQAYDQLIAGTNIALSKPVTCSNVVDVTNIGVITNNDTQSANYFDGWDGDGINALYVEIDLGGLYNIKRVKVWHYYADNRTYYKKKTLVSNDGITWHAIYDQITHGDYRETSNGSEYYILDSMSELANVFNDTSFKFSNYTRGGLYVSDIPGNQHIPTTVTTNLRFKEFQGFKTYHTTVFVTSFTTDYTSTWNTSQSTTTTWNTSQSTTTTWSTSLATSRTTSLSTSQATTTTWSTSLATTRTTSLSTAISTTTTWGTSIATVRNTSQSTTTTWTTSWATGYTTYWNTSRATSEAAWTVYVGQRLVLDNTTGYYPVGTILGTWAEGSYTCRRRVTAMSQVQFAPYTALYDVYAVDERYLNYTTVWGTSQATSMTISRATAISTTTTWSTGYTSTWNTAISTTTTWTSSWSTGYTSTWNTSQSTTTTWTSSWSTGYTTTFNTSQSTTTTWSTSQATTTTWSTSLTTNRTTSRNTILMLGTPII